MTEEPSVVRFDDLLQGFRDIGVRQGDALFFHSSLRSFGRVEGGPEAVIDAAVAAVGAKGTVAVPTFVQKLNGEYASYSARAEVWDVEKSRSDVGRITEVFRRRPEAVRSDDPCNSMAAIGAEARAVMCRHHLARGRATPWEERSYGHGSPWDWLVERNAVYLLMGVAMNACSLLHYVQALWLENRYGPGPMREGPTWPRFDLAEVGGRVRDAGLVRRTRVGDSTWQSFRTAPFVQKALDVLAKEPELIEEMRLRLWRG